MAQKYIPIDWDSSKALSAENLNHMEDGIYDLYTRAKSCDDSVQQQFKELNTICNDAEDALAKHIEKYNLKKKTFMNPYGMPVSLYTYAGICSSIDNLELWVRKGNFL